MHADLVCRAFSRIDVLLVVLLLLLLLLIHVIYNLVIYNIMCISNTSYYIIYYTS